MSGRLFGRTALISGGTSGIGYATAERFRAEGATVIVTGRDPDRTAKAGADLGVDAVVSDLGEPAASSALADRIRERYGNLDVVVANAGVSGTTPFGATTPEQFDDIFRVNIRGMYFFVQAMLPLLRHGSSVVLVSSVGGRIGMPWASVYGASKAAVRSLGRSLAGELLDRGIRVNTLSPGGTETPIIAKSGIPYEQTVELMTSPVPMKRLGGAAELAAAALFLASDDSSFCTGTELVVAGGHSDI